MTELSDSPRRKAANSWQKRLAPYRSSSRWAGLFELVVTLVPFGLFWAGAYLAYEAGFWWGFVLTIPAAAFLVRLFMIQHDCGHGAFFGQRVLDDWVGRAIGVLTLTPYDCWRQTHAIHHASSGNLDARGTGDIATLTVAEYRASSSWQRLKYRLYRHPAVMFLLGPIWSFLIAQRVPVGLMRKGATPWVTVMLTNLATATLVGLMIWLVGWLPFLMVQGPIVLLASGAGVWLFYVQHQFEDTHWTDRQDWAFEHAALHGSSYYDLPAPLRWVTANIGVHHVHHVSSRIPFYRLPQVLRDFPELKTLGRVGILDSIRSVRLVLWDEGKRKLISFRQERLEASLISGT